MTDSTLTRPFRRTAISCSNAAAIGRHCGSARRAVEKSSSRMSKWQSVLGSNCERAALQTFARRILVAAAGMAA